MEENKSTPIEVNLKLPNDSQDELSLGDIIRFLWNGRKTLLIFTVAGLILGAVISGLYFLSNRPAVTGGVATATVKYLYPEALSGQMPDLTPLNHSMLLSSAVIDPAAVAASESVEISSTDLRSNLKYTPVEGDAASVNITLSLDTKMVEKNVDGAAALSALLDAYQLWFNERYGKQAQIEKEVSVAAAEWDGYFEPALNWETLEYDQSFDEIFTRLEALLPFVDQLYLNDPAYSYEGVTFRDLYNDVHALLTGQVDYWMDEMAHNPYVKDAATFKETAVERMSALEQKKALLNELLDIYTSKVSAMGGTVGSVNVFTAEGQVQSIFDELMVDVFDCENEIAHISSSLELIENGANARNAEKVQNGLDGILQRLNEIQETGRVMCIDQQEAESIEIYGAESELIVVSAAPVYEETLSAGASKVQMILILMGLAAAGFFVGLVIVAGKKYLINAA